MTDVTDHSPYTVSTSKTRKDVKFDGKTQNTKYRSRCERKRGGDNDMNGLNVNNRVQGFDIIDADTLMTKPLPKNRFLVESLVPQGVNILAGASKTGKSWLMLDMALKIAAGEPLWGLETTQCDVLYLCLEDTYQRIQERLMKLTDEAPQNLRFSVAAKTLSNGLEQDISDFLHSYPLTKLIIIDTLQKIRAPKVGNVGGVYASDYEDMSALKKISAERGVTIMLVHHLRKQKDSDVFNQISGSTGIIGSADSAYVMMRDARGSNTALLIATGRDIDYQQFRINFENLHWVMVERKDGEELRKERIPQFLFQLVDFMKDKPEWSGTTTELLVALGDEETSPVSAAKSIVHYYYEILYPAGIDFKATRTSKARVLNFKKRDGCDGSDG